MGAQPARDWTRLLAPAALAVFAVLFFGVILSSGSGDSEKTPKTSAASGRRGPTNTRKTSTRAATPATYTVKIGDNLPSISKKTGLSVQKIQELNPQLDPYGLQSGQKIRLRE